MSNVLIRADNVRLVYPIYSIRAQSLRNSVINMAVGGRILRDGHDVIHVSALEGVSFEVHEGQRLGLMGHNGSGKTTLLKVLAGVYEPTSGRVSVQGRVSSMLDINLGMDWEATGIENVMTMGRLRGMTTRAIKAAIPGIIEFSDLGPFINLPVKTYSAGMATRLVFAVATSFEPDILILDEWLGAGDSNFVPKAAKRMNDLVARSRGLVLASHSLDLIRSACDTLLVLDSGRVKYFGSVEGYSGRNAA